MANRRSSVLNPNHCRSVHNSLIRYLHNCAVQFCFVCCFFFSTILKVSGVLFESRYVKTIMCCVNLIRCPIWLHPMLSNANPIGGEPGFFLPSRLYHSLKKKTYLISLASTTGIKVILYQHGHVFGQKREFI